MSNNDTREELKKKGVEWFRAAALNAGFTQAQGDLLWFVVMGRERQVELDFDVNIQRLEAALKEAGVRQAE